MGNLFLKNKFYKEKQVTSPLRYQSKEYRVTCHQIRLNELVIWLDSVRFMQEEIRISREDANILSKHNIQTRKKTTRRFLYNAYAKTVMGKAPEVKKVVDKYCQPAKPLLMVFEDVDENKDFEISREDSAVFTRHGFNIAGKTNHKFLRQNVRDNTINGLLGTTISPEDLAVFRRYGINFSSSGEARGKIKLPLTRSAFLARLLIVCLVLSVAGMTFWHYYGPAVRHYWGKQTQKLKAGLEVAQIKQEWDDISKDTKEARKLHELITDEYPATLGYIDPHPRLLPLIQKSEIFIKKLGVLREKSDLLLKQKKYKNVLESLVKYNLKHEIYADNLGIMRRVLSKLRITKQINNALKKEWFRKENIQSTLSNLRSYVFNAQEMLDAIEEKEALVDEKYAFFKDKIVIEKDIATETKIYKAEVAKIESIITDAENLIVNSAGDYQETEKMLVPYEAFKSNVLNKLRNLYEIIDGKLDGLETLRQKSTNKDDVLVAIAKKSQEYTNLKKYIEEAKKSLQKVQKIPTNLGLKLPSDQISITISVANQEMQNLRSMIAAANKKLDEDKGADAKEMIKQSTKYEEIMEELKIVSNIMTEIEQVAKVLQVENSKRAKEYSRQIVHVKRQVNALNEKLPILKKNISLFQKELNTSQAYVKELQLYKKKYKLYVTTNNSLKKKIVIAEKSFENKKIQEALEKINNTIAKMTNIEKSISQVNQYIKEIKEFIFIVKEQKKQTLLVGRTKRIQKKMSTYTTKLGKILQPLDNKANYLRNNYPISQGYKGLENLSLKTLNDAHRIHSFYKTKLDESKKLTEKNRYEDAIKIIERYEGKRLSPKNFVQNLRKLQSDLKHKLTQAILAKKNKKKGNVADSFIFELQRRHTQLNKIIPQLQNNVQTLRNFYPNILDDTNGFGDVDKYLIFGKQEIEEINELLDESKKLTAQRKYQAVVAMLKPYKESGNISVLPLLTTLNKNSEDILEKLKNPNQKNKIEKRLQAQRQKKQRVRQLKRSPGSWYNSIDTVIRQYEGIKVNIVDSLKGRGSRFVHSAIESEVRKINEYPERLAEIDYSLEFIQQSGKVIENEFSSQKRKELAEYLQSRSIDVNIDTEVFEVQNALNDLQQELRLGGWVEEKTLRNVLRGLQAINRTCEKMYIKIEGPVISIESQIPH